MVLGKDFQTNNNNQIGKMHRFQKKMTKVVNNNNKIHKVGGVLTHSKINNVKIMNKMSSNNSINSRNKYSNLNSNINKNNNRKVISLLMRLIQVIINTTRKIVQLLNRKK